MKLSKIISNVTSKQILNYEDCEIECITQNSKDVLPNSIFFCLKGNNFNGNDYALDAVNNGAKVIVAEDFLPVEATIILVKDVRVAMAQMAKNFYDKSDEKLKKVAVVGTNGKTSTCFIMESILREAGFKVGVIGTNGIYINGQFLPNNLTTPDPIELHYIFNQMLMFDVEIVVMEVSAHAIYYNKIYGIKFDLGIFTNITNEHLDFFNDMENYAKVKMSIFNKKYMNECLVNVDDDYGKIIAKNTNIPCVSYGIYDPANIFAVMMQTQINGSKFTANVNDELLEVKTNLVGEYNIYNSLAGIGGAKLLGVANSKIIYGIKKLKYINGRFMVYSMSLNRKIIVDFAHTPDGFLKVLGLIKKLRKGKIITIFGCVGYSDKEKRIEMGKIASDYSDEIILTSDNPGNVDVISINSDIRLGIDKDKIVTEISDRGKAISFAYNNLKKNDTLVILGKGCETKQVVGSKNINYSDVQVVGDLLKEEDFE